MNQQIRFIGGLWRLFSGSAIKSFHTYAEAEDYLNKHITATPWEELGALAPSDDIRQQLAGATSN